MITYANIPTLQKFTQQTSSGCTIGYVTASSSENAGKAKKIARTRSVHAHHKDKDASGSEPFCRSTILSTIPKVKKVNKNRMNNDLKKIIALVPGFLYVKSRSNKIKMTKHIGMNIKIWFKPVKNILKDVTVQ